MKKIMIVVDEQDYARILRALSDKVQKNKIESKKPIVKDAKYYTQNERFRHFESIAYQHIDCIDRIRDNSVVL